MLKEQSSVSLFWYHFKRGSMKTGTSALYWSIPVSYETFKPTDYPAEAVADSSIDFNAAEISSEILSFPVLAH